MLLHKVFTPDAIAKSNERHNDDVMLVGDVEGGNMRHEATYTENDAAQLVHVQYTM